MKNRLHQLAFAACFTFVGMVITLLGVVTLDNKTKPKTAKQAQVNQTIDCSPTQQSESQQAAFPTTVTAQANNPSHQPKPTSQKTADTSNSVMKLHKGPALLVHDILEPTQPGIEFVPFYNENGLFDKVAVYRQKRGARSTSFDKQMDMMYPLPKASSQFPPISEAQAQQKAQAFKPNSYPQYQGRLVTFASVDVPYYYFKMQNQDGALLVDALTGMAQTISAKELADEKKFQQLQGEGLGDVMKVGADGKFYTAPEILEKIPERERKVIQAEQNFFNEMIEKGLLKVNQDGDFIEDNMTAEHRAKFDHIMEDLLGSAMSEDMH